MRRVAKAAAFSMIYSLFQVSAAAQPAAWNGPMVIVIGIDGMSVDGVLKAKDPNLHLMMDHGAWTLEARGVMPTLSSPNWESAITGAAPEQHGITSNGIVGSMFQFEPIRKDAEGHFPTIFEVLKTQQPSARIAIFHEWAGFADLLEKSIPDVLQHESNHEKTSAAAMEYWKTSRPALLFVHLNNVDHTGHDEGWGTAGYYRAVADADRDVGQFLAMVREANAEDRTYILVTSDHGGKGRNHGGNSIGEIQIPWMITGPDITTGRLASPVYIYDTAATLAWLFGINAPDCWIGRPVVSAFRQTAVRHGVGTPGCPPHVPADALGDHQDAGPGH